MVFEDGARQVKINRNVLALIYSYCQIEKTMPEAGGILVGRENIINDNLIIDKISTPMQEDQQTRTRFNRKDKGHLSFFQKLYNDSEQTARYVGEWHTHPEDFPHYSPIDLHNWHRIKREIKDGKNQYHVIAGRQSLVVWKCDNDKLLPVKVASVLWKNLDLDGEQA